MSPLRTLALLSLGLVVACAATRRPAEPPASPPAAPSDSAHAPAASATPPDAPEPAEAEATPDQGPDDASAKACPPHMKLVDGDYCTDVDVTCLHQWYDKSNKKDICEEFKPPSRCVGDKVKKRYCIDEYSWPNVKGERPEVMNNFYQAQVKCASIGKRLCTESEWTLACEGPEMKPFPYGYVRDATKCNGDHMWDEPDMKKVAKRDPHELARLWKGVRNGAQPACVSDYGIYDLPGNTDDVVASETYASDFRGKFDSVHTGGPWYKGVRNACRPKIYTHDEGFYYYFLGFRCCSNPDGEANDPRTPKQVKRKDKFTTVERLARFTVADMKKKLELKAQNKCDCREEDSLCKTMCGTLLGPEARDAVLDAPREQEVIKHE